MQAVAIALGAYIALVGAFESLIGVVQPANESTLVITTTDAGGSPGDRVVSRLESDGQLYVAANHWPRAWYRTALENPEVFVAIDGEKNPYRAVPVTGEEFERVNAEHRLPVVFKFLTGFPPRKLMRLEPR